MSSGYALHPEAFADLDDISGYIAQENPNAADRVMSEIFDAIRELVRFPNQGHKRPDLTSRPLRFTLVREYLIGLLDRDATADPFFPGSRTTSDFWIDHETFADIRRWAHESGLLIGEVAHPGLGVKYNWNPTMEEFGWVSLLVPVLGLKGATKRRMFDSGLDGPGIAQLWVPN